MKTLLTSALIAIVSIVGLGATASAQPKLCSMPASYRAIYEYPTGSYWVNQIAHYPSYYAAHNTFYQTKYGC